MNHSERFDNIFLGIGGFHMEKIIIACCGKYLEESGSITFWLSMKFFTLKSSRQLWKVVIMCDKNREWQLLFHATNHNLDLIGVAWGKLEDNIENLLEDLDSFRITGSSRSPLFEYWYKFINCIAPVLRDFNT